MPCVLIVNSVKFYVYFNDHGLPHVHVIKDNAEAKFLIETGECISSSGFSQKSLSGLALLVVEHSQEFLEAWRRYYEKK